MKRSVKISLVILGATSLASCGNKDKVCDPNSPDYDTSSAYYNDCVRGRTGSVSSTGSHSSYQSNYHPFFWGVWGGNSSSSSSATTAPRSSSIGVSSESAGSSHFGGFSSAGSAHAGGGGE